MTILGNSVLILPDRIPEQTRKSNLVVPETAKSMQPDEGIIIQSGPECTEVKQGAHVIFLRKTFSVMEIEGKLHYIGNENQISYIY